MPNLILASQSPRRRQLMEQAGFNFQVIKPPDEVEQSARLELPPRDLVKHLAKIKAAHVISLVDDPQTIVIAADTVADLDGQEIGKPDDRNHARQILQTFSGRLHQVHTGLCVRNSQRVLSEVATTDLRMDRLSEEQIEAYLETGKWEGKAGAFGYQDGWDWLHVQNGQESNVVGLPMDLLNEMLRSIGYLN